MKKILIIVAMFGIVGSAFADTLRILKPATITNGVHFVEYKMKRCIYLNLQRLRDNEYFKEDGLVYYRINGKLYTTSLFEIEYDD